ncbi:hypothetical protein TrVFT333_002466 [Trichoderma virens FT-333]|nr:hypothetical protein TrVFT333_002466 [Trichoderma virens FT-333]
MMLYTNLFSLLTLAGVAKSRRIASHGGLNIDVYHAAPEPVVYQKSNNLEFSPTAFTLIHGCDSAVLVDAPTTVNHTNLLAEWIEKTIPGKKLDAIYITHVQGNFNIDILPKNGEFYLEGHVMRAVEVGQGDIMNATVLHVPTLDMVVTGDVVYGNCFQMFEETNTTALQNLWIKGIHKVKALKPKIVIPSHMHEDEGFGPSHLQKTEQYIVNWQKAKKRSHTWQELEAAMKRQYPERTGSFVLRVSAQTEFGAAFS